MDVRSAELTRYAANAMLATKISFMNELANMARSSAPTSRRCARASAPTRESATTSSTPAAGAWRKLLPEDVQALGAPPTRSASGPARKEVEGGQQPPGDHFVHKTRQALRRRDKLAGKTIAVWGLAFKPNTDDMRAAPSRTL